MATDFRPPVEKFLVKKIQEYFPDFDLREGTAFRDMLIKPMILLLQPYRDQTNILKRNQSLQNFESMNTEELDALVANLFVTRRSGTVASGTVRVYLSAAQQVAFSTDVQFQTSEGLIFHPSEAIGFSAEELALNADGIYYYCDVPAVAEKAGAEYNVAAHAIVYIAGGPAGVVKVDNLATFALGVDTEDNATLAKRAETAITVRDLVAKRAIQSCLLENFPTMREVAVVGYGDAEMTRDTMSAVLDLTVTIDRRYTGVVSADGYTFTDRDDVNPINFLTSGVRPGHSLRIFSTGDDQGSHTIEAVTATSLTLYTPLVGTGASDVEYGIDGIANVESYHVGGKVDVYLDDTQLEEGQFYLEPATAENELDPDVVDGVTLPVVGIKSLIEVYPESHAPLVASTDENYGDYVLWPEDTRFVNDRSTGEIILEGGYYYLQDSSMDFSAASFQGITGIRSGFKVVIVDGADAGEHTLDAVSGSGAGLHDRLRLEGYFTVRSDVNYRVIASDYRLVSDSQDTRLSPNEVITLELINTTDTYKRYYVGSYLAATFYGDSQVDDVQTYLDNEYNRVVTASVLARRCLPTFVDLEISYRGDIAETDLQDAVAEYINGLAVGADLEVSDLVATMYFLQVSYIRNDFVVRATTTNLDDTSTYQESGVLIEIPRTSKYIARSIKCVKMEV